MTADELIQERLDGNNLTEMIGHFRKIVDSKTAGHVPGLGHVDMNTANIVASVHDQLNPDNQKKFVKMHPAEMVDLALRIGGKASGKARKP